MALRIIWSPNALSDRIQILEYWFLRIGNKTYSRRLDVKLKETIKHLSRFPEIGRQIDQRDERFLVRDYYQIFYITSGNEIHILHIWDSRRDPNDFFYTTS
jgi:plasmid stabilization system protein ParE